MTTHVGKESNKFEAVEAGLEHDPDEVWTEYADPARDSWTALVLPVLRAMPPREVATAVGMSERRLRDLLTGRARPTGRRRRRCRASRWRSPGTC